GAKELWIRGEAILNLFLLCLRICAKCRRYGRFEIFFGVLDETAERDSFLTAVRSQNPGAYAFHDEAVLWRVPCFLRVNWWHFNANRIHHGNIACGDQLVIRLRRRCGLRERFAIYDTKILRRTPAGNCDRKSPFYALDSFEL